MRTTDGAKPGEIETDSRLLVDDNACLRGRGWTLFQAVTGLYYWGTNPGMIRQASHALSQVLAGT
jgi:hypothetical protein